MNQIIYAGKHLLTFSVTRHAHSSWEMIYCTGGSGTLLFDGDGLRYQAFDLLLVPPLVYHRNESETGFTNIHLNMLEPTWNVKQPTLLHDDGNRFLLDAFNGAFYHFSREPGKHTPLLAAYANLIVAQVNEALTAEALSPVVEEIIARIINSYPNENFELEELLRSYHFNYDYLRKLFKQETGKTPHRLLNELRMQAAAERLSTADSRGVSISEIAHLCGFREPLYFSRMFRKQYGISPSEYQAQQREAGHSAQTADSIKIKP